MKRVISLIFVLAILLICLCACSDSGKNNSSLAGVQSEITSNAELDIQSDLQVDNSSKPDVSSNTQSLSTNWADKSPLVDMENLSAAVIEKFTDKQLEWVHNNAEKFPKNFVFSNLEDCTKIFKSASSKQEAVENAKEKFTTSVYDVAQCKVLSETENLYIVYAKLTLKNKPNSSKFREEKSVCFKESVFDTDDGASTGKILVKNKTLIKNIFDYVYYTRYCNLGGYKVLYSELTEEKANLKYTVYYVGTTYGGTEVMDDVSLYKQEIVVAEVDKEFEQKDKVTIKKISVIGEGYDGGDGLVGE